MVWPQLVSVESSPALTGGKLVIVGHGGYLQFETETGIEYDESSRSFQLFLDGKEIGEIICFVNRCEGEIVVPIELEAGEYELSAEGGSILLIDIAES
jgi:hypothetical protein